MRGGRPVRLLPLVARGFREVDWSQAFANRTVKPLERPFTLSAECQRVAGLFDPKEGLQMYAELQISEAKVDRAVFVNEAGTFASVQLATPDRRTFIELVGFESEQVETIKSLAVGTLVSARGALQSNKGKDGVWRLRCRADAVEVKTGLVQT